MLFFAACAAVCARLSRHVMPRASRESRILISSLILPILLFIVGFFTFVETEIVDWLLSRPWWAWVNIACVFISSVFAAWLVVRREPQKVDVSQFE
jgi:hypothetical protein